MGGFGSFRSLLRGQSRLFFWPARGRGTGHVALNLFPTVYVSHFPEGRGVGGVIRRPDIGQSFSRKGAQRYREFGDDEGHYGTPEEIMLPEYLDIAHMINVANQLTLAGVSRLEGPAMYYQLANSASGMSAEDADNQNCVSMLVPIIVAGLPNGEQRLIRKLLAMPPYPANLAQFCKDDLNNNFHKRNGPGGGVGGGGGLMT